jgi:hypothetical protein
MQVKKLAALLVAIAFVFGMVGCANKDLTPEQRTDQMYKAVFTARAQLNDFIRSYQAYKTVLTPEKQLDVATVMVPIFEKADFALDQWELALAGGDVGYGQYEMWIQIKREITMMMFQLGIFEVKE